MSSLSATYTLPAPYSASWSFSPAAVPGAPTTTALGSPSALAAVSSSNVDFLTVAAPESDTAESTRTSTSAICLSPISSSRSDQLLGGEVVGDRSAAVALVLHGLTSRTRRGVLVGLDRGPSVGQADLAGVQTDVAERLRLDRLALGRHDALERRVPRVVDLLDHADHGRGAALHRLVPGVGDPLDGDGR